MKEKSKFITLKEAAEISGYAPDYIGQLIRKGKLPGKQVYYNVAWMTTEKDLRDYMNKATVKGKSTDAKESFWDRVKEFKTRLVMESRMTKLFRYLLYFTIVVCSLFILMLIYIISVNLDKKLQQKELKKIQNTIPKIENKNPEFPTL